MWGHIALRPPLRPNKVKMRRRKRETVPEAIRHEVLAFGRLLREDYGPLFAANPRLKHAVARLLASELPPLPRRPGRP